MGEEEGSFMVDLQSILASHHPKSKRKKNPGSQGPIKGPIPSSSEIPDLFFDEILVKHKLNRVETLVLMFLYRQVWCRPNLYEIYGFCQVLSHADVAQKLGIPLDEFLLALRKLESLTFIETIRSGQYFVRKYFTEENDRQFGHTYDNF